MDLHPNTKQFVKFNAECISTYARNALMRIGFKVMY